MLGRIQSSVNELRCVTDAVAHDLKSPVTSIRGTLESALSNERNVKWRDSICEAIGRVLERFVKGEHSPGHGLGLSFVDAVTRAHGGSVNISDRPEAGTVVTLSLPAKALEAALLQLAKCQGQMQVRPHKRLVVFTNAPASDQGCIVAILQEHGQRRHQHVITSMTVEDVSVNGEEAWENAELRLEAGQYLDDDALRFLTRRGQLDYSQQYTRRRSFHPQWTRPAQVRRQIRPSQCRTPPNS